MGIFLFAVLSAAILVVVGRRLVSRYCAACNASRIVFTDERGVEMQDVIFTEGDQPRSFRVRPLKDNGEYDDTIENPQHGYGTADSGLTTAEDGSSSFELLDPLTFRVAPLAPSATGPGGNPVPSVIATSLDSATEPGQQQIIGGLFRVTVLPRGSNATHVEYEELHAEVPVQ